MQDVKHFSRAQKEKKGLILSLKRKAKDNPRFQRTGILK